MKKIFKMAPLLLVGAMLLVGVIGSIRMASKLSSKPKKPEAEALKSNPASSTNAPPAVATGPVKNLVRLIYGTKIAGGFITESDEILRVGAESSFGSVREVGKDFFSVEVAGKIQRIFVETWRAVTARWTGTATTPDGNTSVFSSLGRFAIGEPSPIGGKVCSVTQRLAEVRFDDGGGILVQFDPLPVEEIAEPGAIGTLANAGVALTGGEKK